MNSIAPGEFDLHEEYPLTLSSQPDSIPQWIWPFIRIQQDSTSSAGAIHSSYSISTSRPPFWCWTQLDSHRFYTTSTDHKVAVWQAANNMAPRLRTTVTYMVQSNHMHEEVGWEHLMHTCPQWFPLMAFFCSLRVFNTMSC